MVVHNPVELTGASPQLFQSGLVRVVSIWPAAPTQLFQPAPQLFTEQLFQLALFQRLRNFRRHVVQVIERLLIERARELSVRACSTVAISVQP